MKRFLVSLIWGFTFVNGFAQITSTSPDSAISENYFTTDFDNSVSSAFLYSRLNYSLDEKKYRLTIRNNFRSNVTKLQENFFRDFNELNFIADYKVSDIVYTGLGVSISTLSDDKSIAINQSAHNFYFANFDYYPNQMLVLNSKIGYLTDDQIGEKNTGFRGELNSDIGNLRIEDYLTNAYVRLAYEDLTQKENYNYQTSAEVFKEFTPFSNNTARLSFYSRRNDFYFPASTDIKNQFNINNNIESRIETYFNIEDDVQYLLSNNYLFTLSGGFSSKNILKELRYKSTGSTVLFDNNYDTERRENRLRFGADLDMSFANNITRIGILHTERSEINEPTNLGDLNATTVRQLQEIEKAKNNNSSRTSLFLDNLYRLSNTNTFKFAGSSSILRYDTDSDQNYDDRDELLLIGEISHTYNNLSTLILETLFDVSSNKLAYIYKERSSNNNTNTIYRLTSNSTFQPFEALWFKNSVQVLANYTVYEFEDLVSQVTSFSYRQLTVKDSIYYNITDNFFVNLFTGLKLSEQGEFNDEQFTVRPLVYFEDVNLHTTVNYVFFDFIELSAGYKFFQQKRFNYNEGVKVLNSTIRTFGPISGLRVFFKNNSYIHFTGGIDFYKYDNSTNDNSAASMIVRIIWNI
jgi:hypothetical protein